MKIICKECLYKLEVKKIKSLVEKSILMGLGAISLTKERAEKFAQELVEKGEATSEEARRLAGELVERGEEEKVILKEMVSRQMEDLRKSMGIVTKDDLYALEERIKRLEERTGMLSPEGIQ
ncbi:MAG TPA: polyhydroxyalkanoate synthesis regulator [Firmicutes bacterium]|nr:polyhydroxyalkanoate synthesis regulator [Bacillota bacterium]